MERPRNLKWILCVSLLHHPSLLMMWLWGLEFKEVLKQKMAEIAQFLLHSEDPGAIKLRSRYGFYLHFLGRELVRPKWVLPTCGQFKFSRLLNAASYVSSILGVSVSFVSLINYYYLCLLGAFFLSVFSTHMLYLFYPHLSYLISY